MRDLKYDNLEYDIKSQCEVAMTDLSLYVELKRFTSTSLSVIHNAIIVKIDCQQQPSRTV